MEIRRGQRLSPLPSQLRRAGGTALEPRDSLGGIGRGPRLKFFSWSGSGSDQSLTLNPQQPPQLLSALAGLPRRPIAINAAATAMVTFFTILMYVSTYSSRCQPDRACHPILPCWHDRKHLSAGSRTCIADICRAGVRVHVRRPSPETHRKRAVEQARRRRDLNPREEDHSSTRLAGGRHRPD